MRLNYAFTMMSSLLHSKYDLSLDGARNPAKFDDQDDPSLAGFSVTSRVMEIYCSSSPFSISQFVTPAAHEIGKIFRRLGI
jgi:hypothetical protein